MKKLIAVLITILVILIGFAVWMVVSSTKSDGSKEVADKPEKIELVFESPSQRIIQNENGRRAFVGTNFDADGRNPIHFFYDKDAVWSSSDPTVAVVGKNGKVKTLNCGETIIRYESVSGKKAGKSFVLTVGTLADSVKIIQNDLTLKQGQSYDLTAAFSPKYVFNEKLEWESSDEEIVTVDNGVVNAKQIGRATITCKTTDGSNKSASCEISVTAMKFRYVDQLKRGYPTGCEAASCCMLLQQYGIDVDLKEMISFIPNEQLRKANGKWYGPDIHEKFVGDPHGYYDSPVPGYGAFSPVVVKALQKAIDAHGGGYTAKMITGCSADELYSHLKKGEPAVVWATYKMVDTPKTNSWVINSTNKEFSYPKGTHVTLLTGCSQNYIVTVDPYDGNGVLTFPKAKFEEKWNLLGNQAIIIEKK